MNKHLELIADILFLVITMFLHQANAQEIQNKTKNTKIYTAKIVFMDQTKAKGILYNINDSTIELQNINIDRIKNPAINLLNYKITNNNSRHIPVMEINNIYLRKINSVSSGIIIGAFTGGFVGGIIGNKSYEPCEGGLLECMFDFGPAPNILLGSLSGFLSGGLIGSMLGAIPMRFHIGGNLSQYQKVKEQIKTIQAGFPFSE
ncbi:MAG TPA: hypothetical protein VI583_17850 [Cyclobacteriaceae bacterium]|nr:hypothetical protein [Cyclobacteriaceae bacterium]